MVICDRFYHASMAYQGYGRGIPLDFISRLTDLVCDRYRPEMTVLLDIEPAVGLARARARNQATSTRMRDDLKRKIWSFTRVSAMDIWNLRRVIRETRIRRRSIQGDRTRPIWTEINQLTTVALSRCFGLLMRDCRTNAFRFIHRQSQDRRSPAREIARRTISPRADFFRT